MLTSRLQNEIDLIKKVKKVYDTREILDNILKKRFTTSEVGISSRLLFHWEKSGLLMETYEEGRWKRFNIIEYTWLKIIMELRKFDFSHTTIKKIKDILFARIEFEDLPENINEILKSIAPDGKKEKVEQILDSMNLAEQFNELKINYLEIFIQSIILLRSNFLLLVNLEGDCIPFKLEDIEVYSNDDAYLEFLDETFISISISKILKDFMLKNNNAKPAKKLKLLDDREIQVLNKIRNEKVISVMVMKDNQNEIEMIEEFRKENVDKSARLMNILMSDGYQTITLKTQKGVIVDCMNIVKTKLKQN